jgi:fibronectin-binding autotransporter adhesin
MRSRILDSNLFRVFSVLLATLSLLFCASAVLSADLYWNPPSGGNGTWDTTTTKWSINASGPLDTVWNNSNGDNAIMPSASSAYTVTIATGGISVQNITNYNSGSSDWTNEVELSGGPITLVGTATINNSTSGTGRGMAIRSVIAGTSGLIKTGVGYLDIWGNNTYSGVTDLQMGVVDPQIDTAFGTSSVIVESGVTVWSWNGITRTFSNAFTINGNGDGNGALQEQNGTMNLNGPLTLGSNATIHTIGGSYCNIAGNVTGNNNIFTVTQDGGGGTVISGNMNLGTGALSMPSNGTVTLTGTANTWSGGTTLACNGWGGSVLNIGNGGAGGSIGSSGTITIPSGAHTQGTAGTDYATINFNTSSNLTLNNYITGGGDIALVSTNNGTITFTGSSDYSHNTTINGGTLRITNSYALGTSTVTIGGGTSTGQLQLSAGISPANIINLGGRQSSPTPGPHLRNVSGNNTIGGGISLTTGGDQYVIQSDADKLTIASITDNTATTTARYVYFQGNGDGEVTGAIGSGTGTGPISLTKSGSGTLTLSGTNTLSGSTTINAGTLSLGASGSIANSSAITVNTGAYFNVSGLSAGLTLGSGSTTQTLQGAGTVQGSIINGAHGYISPAGTGTAGTLNIQNLTLGSASGGIVNFDLSSSTSSGNDLLNVTGNLSALGSSSPQSTTFNINMIGGSLATGTYKLVNYGSWDAAGNISNIGLSGVGAGVATTRQHFELSRTGNEIDLTVSGSPASLVWKGNISNTWARGASSDKNWLNGGVADSYFDLDTLTFDANGAAQSNVNVSGAWTPGSVIVNSSTNYTFSGTGSISGGSAMTLNKSGTGTLFLINTGGNNFGGGIYINSGTLQIGDGTNNSTIASANSITNNSALIIYPAADVTMANFIGGSGTLTKMGTAVLTMTSSNAYTSATTINAGKIIMGNAYAFGPVSNTSTVTVNSGGTLDLNSTNAGIDSRVINVTGTGYDGNGALVNNGLSDITSSFHGVVLNGNTTIGGSARWDIRGTGAYLAGNNHALTKSGTGYVFLVDLSYTNLSAVTINNGNLCLQGTTIAGSSSTLAPITVNSGGTLSVWGIGAPVANSIALNGGNMGTVSADAGAATFSGAISLASAGGTLTNAATSSTLTVSGQIIGTGLLTKNGSGTVILTNTNNTWGGGTTINDGTLQIGNGGANGSLPGTGTITYTSTTSTLVFNSASNLSVPNYITGSAAGVLTKSGSGTTTLSGTNDFTGTINVNGSGALRLTSSTALGASANIANISGGADSCRIELANNVTIQQPIVLSGRSNQTSPHIINSSGANSILGAISFATSGNYYVVESKSGSGNKLTLSSVTDSLDTNRYLVLTGGGDGEVTDALANSGTGAFNVIKDGTGKWTLSGYNTHNGSTTVKAGTLALSNSSSIASVAASMLLDVKSGATLDVSGINSGGGLVLGNGSTTQTQTLAGSGTIVGAVTTTPGSTTTTPAVPFSAVAPGGLYSVGTMTLNGNLTFAGTGDTITYDINGSTGDLLNVNGDLTLGGATGSETVLAISVLAKPMVSTYTVAAVTDPSKSLIGTAFTVSAASNTTRYTFTPSVNTVAKTITLGVTGSNASLIWNSSSSSDIWDVKNSSAAFWKNGANPADMYYNADDVAFDDTASNKTVNLNTTVVPLSVTFNSSANYTLTGTGKISGATGLVKDGTGMLSISTTNDYSGQTEVKNGVLQFNASAAYTSLTNNIVINNGASLDMQNYGGGPTAIPVPIKIAGTGYNGQGAIYASVAPNWEYGIVNKLELTGEATIGTGGAWRWDIVNPSPGDSSAGYIKGNGFALTKIGAGQIWVKQLGDIGVGDINITAGQLGFQQTIGAGDPSKTITISTSANIGLWDTGQYQVINKKLDFKDGTTFYSGGGTAGNSWAGDTKLEGIVTCQTDVHTTLTGNITGTGSAGGLTKAGTAILTLSGTQNYSGVTTLNAGTLQLSGSGTIGDVANTVTLEMLDGNHTVGNITGAGTTILDAGAALTATSIIQNTVTLGAGSRITIVPIPGGPQAGTGSLTAVPEPSTLAMLVLAAMGLGIYCRRSR